MGQNFDDYPGFQLFFTLGKHFAPECITYLLILQGLAVIHRLSVSLPVLFSDLPSFRGGGGGANAPLALFNEGSVRYQSAALPCKNNCANHPIKEVHHPMKRILANTYTLLLIEKQNVTCCSYDPTFIVKNVQWTLEIVNSVLSPILFVEFCRIL